MSINISLAAYPGLRHVDAAITAIGAANTGTLQEPLFGAISADHIQLVPQNFGKLDDELCEMLQKAYPRNKFRLHANVRVTDRHTLAEVSGFDLHKDWFIEAARISKLLNAPAYTAHSGSRAEASMTQMLDNARRMADLFGCAVGIEGQYPCKDNHMLVTSWEEYREVFDSGVPYAIDLSHLNILAHKTKRYEMELIGEMLNCERCIEVHVSDNDGRGDWHQVCENKPWWWDLMSKINENAVIFTEGNHRRKKETA